MEVINLNLIPNGTNPVVHCSQYDEGREFRFNLFNGTSVLTLDGTETIECDVKKPDGNVVTVAVTNTSSNYIVVTTTLQMCACSGNSLGTINIQKGGVNLYTLNFILYCERSPLENGIQSDSAIHNLETQVETIVSEQYDSANVIFDNVPTSGHGIPYTVTSEGIKDAIDNAISGLTIPENITDLADVDVTTPTDGEILVYNNGTWENQANPASTANFGPDYDENTTYNTGDKVIYQGLFYVCNDDNVTGTWDATKWDSLTVADLNGKLLPMSTTDPDKVADRIEALEYKKGDVISGYIYTSGMIYDSTHAYCMLPLNKVLRSDITGGTVGVTNTVVFSATGKSQPTPTSVSLNLSAIENIARLDYTYPSGTFTSSQYDRPCFISLYGSITFT